MGKSHDIEPGDLLYLKKDLLNNLYKNTLAVRMNHWFSGEYELISRGSIFTVISVSLDQVKIKKSSRVRKLISRSEGFYNINLLGMDGKFFKMFISEKRMKDVWSKHSCRDVS